jgi:hypothetical protein
MPSETFNLNTADILMLTLRSELLPEDASDPTDPNYGHSFGSDPDSFIVRTDRSMCIKALMRKWYYPDDADPYYEDTLLDDSQIVQYSIDEQGGESGFDIGTVISASYHLTLDNTTVRRTAADFTNTRFAVALGLKTGNSIRYEPFGVWTVTNVNASEQSATIEIDGLDALGVEYEKTYSPYAGGTGESGIFIDYGTIGHLMDAVISIYDDTEAPIDSDITAAWGSRTDTNGTPYRYSWNAMQAAGSGPDGWYEHFVQLSVPSLFYTMTSSGNMSRRTIISWFAEACGYFARMGRDGSLCFKIYPAYEGTYVPIYINPAQYFTYTPHGIGAFKYNQLTGQYYWNTEDDIRTIVRKEDENIVSTAANTLQMFAPPLLVSSNAANAIGRVHERYRDYLRVQEAMTVVYRGAPSVTVGDHFRVTDLNNVQHSMIVNSMTTTYNGGLSQTISCNLPSAETAYSASYNAHQTLLEKINTSVNFNKTDKIDVTSQYSISKTSGNLTINSFKVYKSGAIIFFALQTSTSAATAAGSNAFTGSISGPYLPNINQTGFAGLWGGGILSYIAQSDGTLIFRVHISSFGTAGWSGVNMVQYFC